NSFVKTVITPSKCPGRERPHKTSVRPVNDKFTSIGCGYISSLSGINKTSTPVSSANYMSLFSSQVKMFYLCLIMMNCNRNRISEEHTSELQSRIDIVCCLLLE